MTFHNLRSIRNQFVENSIMIQFFSEISGGCYYIILHYYFYCVISFTVLDVIQSTDPRVFFHTVQNNEIIFNSNVISCLWSYSDESVSYYFNDRYFLKMYRVSNSIRMVVLENYPKNSTIQFNLKLLEDFTAKIKNCHIKYHKRLFYRYTLRELVLRLVA